MGKRLYYSLAISLLLAVSIGCKSQTDRTKVAGQEDAVELYNLGKRHADGEGVEMEKSKAVENLIKAAEQGNAKAQSQDEIGVYVPPVEGAEATKIEPIKWILVDDKAQARFGDRTAHTKKSRAVENLIKEAEQGNAKAQYELGCCYMSGEGVEMDELEAVKWFRKAAEQGYDEAQIRLGDCYAYSINIKNDMSEAVKWYRKAAEQGNAYAQHTLGECYAQGKGVGADMTEAVKWLFKSAEQGFSIAQYDLGMRYVNGDGVEKNMTEAVKWLRKSAEQGWTKAQLELGRCYVMGKGIEKNMPEALKWLRKAAADTEKYDAYDDALRIIGESYASHDGVPAHEDSYEYVEDYWKAMEQRTVYALGILGLRYTNSDGSVSIDNEAPSPETLCGICYEEFGPFGPSERWTMDFAKPEIIYEFSAGAWGDPRREKVVCQYLFDKEETAKVISDCRSFDFSKWKHRYDDRRIIDGDFWRMTLKYSDGRQREISGANKWPETFNLFNTVITNAYFKAKGKRPNGQDEIKADIKGGKYNDPRESYLWKKIK